MGETQVAEGPLIRHIPGGYAEWRQKESGLPPARLRSSEGEWWGKLVADPTPTLKEPEPIVKPEDGPTGPGPTGPIDSPDPDFDPDALIDPSDPNWDYYDDKKVEPYEWKTDYKPTDWSTDFEIPKGYGWGTPDATLPYGGGLDAGDITGRTPRERDFRFYDYPGMTDPPMIGPQLPAKPDDSLGTGFQDPIVIRHPRPLTGKTIQNIGGTRLGGDKPFIPYRQSDIEGAVSGIKGVVTDILGGVESMSDAILGKTQYDQYPRPPKEKALGRLLGKWNDLMQGKAEEGLLLWETQGVPSSLGNRTPFGPDYVDTLKNLDKIIKNEHNIKTQEYGQLQVIAIMNMAKLISMYGPIGAVPATVLTLAKDIMSGFKNAFADHPEFRGNPVQDVIHGTTWVMGQTLEKTYNATLRKLVDKVDGEKLKEKLSKLNIIEYMKAPDVPTGVKITYTPPKTTRLSERGGEPQMPIPAVPPTGRINPPWHEPVIAKVTGEPQVPIGEPPTAKPVRIRREEAGEVTGEAVGQPVTDPFTSITSDKEEYKGTEQAETKTITGPLGEFPQGELPTTDILPSGEVEIREGDPLGGGFTDRPTGEPVQMTDEEARNLGLLPEELEDLDKVIDAETMLKIRQQVGLERRQTQFKETGKFKDDAVNEAFTKGAYNWLEHGAADYEAEVDTDERADNQNIANIEQAMRDINYQYDQLYQTVQNSAEYGGWDQTTQQRVDQNAALDGIERERSAALEGYYQQIRDIQTNNSMGAGVETFTTQSAVGIYLNNPGITPEEAVEQAKAQAGGAADKLYDDSRSSTDAKASDFWHEITEQVSGQLHDISQQQAEAKSASNTAQNEQRKDDFEAQQAATQAIKDKSDKQLAKNQAAAKAFTKEMKAFYEKLSETEPLLGAKGSADLAKLGVTGQIVYDGTDGGVVLVKDKDGKVVSYAYVSPEDKKLIDETMEGWISEGDPYLKGPIAVMDPSTGYVPKPDDPKPDEPGP